MSTMTVFDVIVIYNDKSTIQDTSGPYYGSFLDHSAAHRRATEYENDKSVFMASVKASTVMA